MLSPWQLRVATSYLRTVSDWDRVDIHQQFALDRRRCYDRLQYDPVLNFQMVQDVPDSRPVLKAKEKATSTRR